jgi:hypothetical protein
LMGILTMFALPLSIRNHYSASWLVAYVLFRAQFSESMLGIDRHA